MQMMKQTISLILVLFFLTGCSLLLGLSNIAPEASPAATSAQTVLPATLEMPPPVVTTTLVSTSLAGLETSSITPQPTGAASEVGTIVTTTCQLEPVTQPPWPDNTTVPNELDEELDLHITGRPQRIDLATYRLKVTGLVDHPLSLSYDDLRCMPKVTDNPELICPSVFTDYATWTGVPIKYILELAGLGPGATKLTLVSADGFEVQLLLDIASADKNFLAYEVNGKPLPVEHGFPLRAVFPSLWGSYWLKWLVEIRIS